MNPDENYEDGWLEAAYEERTHIADDDNPELWDMQDDWDDEDAWDEYPA